MPLFVGQVVTTPVFPHQCIPYSSAEKKTENFYFCNIFSPSRVLLPAGGNQTSKDVETSIASAVTIVLIILFAKKYLRKEQLRCSTQNATRRTSVQWASFSKRSTVTSRKLPLALLVGKKRKKSLPGASRAFCLVSLSWCVIGAGGLDAFFPFPHGMTLVCERQETMIEAV